MNQGRPVAGRYLATGDRWSWSESMYDLVGVARDVTPGPGPLLALVGGEERELLGPALTDPTTEPFVVRCRGTRADGRERRLTLTGRWSAGPDGPCVSGSLVDTTDEEAALRQRAAALELERAVASHAAVDHAKGMLTVLYGLDGNDAFELLRWRSQQVNVPLATLARQLVGALTDAGGLRSDRRAATAHALAAALDEPVGTEVTRSGRASGATVERLDDDPPRVLIVGTVDVPSARHLAHEVADAWDLARASRRLTIDLREAAPLGAAGTGVVLAAARRARRDEVALEVETRNDTELTQVLQGVAQDTTRRRRPPR